MGQSNVNLFSFLIFCFSLRGNYAVVRLKEKLVGQVCAVKSEG